MYLSDMMLQLKKPVMLVGNAGSAKTVILNSLLRKLDDESAHFALIFALTHVVICKLNVVVLA